MCTYGYYEQFELLLQKTKLSRCIDQRDHIFTLLSLCSDGEQGFATQPNYTKSVEKVYIEMTAKMILYHRELRVLTTIEMREDRMGRPSWVPYWSIAIISENLDYCVASANAHVRVDFLLGQTPQVYGKIIDTVQRAEPFDVTVQVLELVPLKLKRVITTIGLEGIDLSKLSLYVESYVQITFQTTFPIHLRGCPPYRLPKNP